MYHILAGKQRALQFPVMCNACVKIGYSDNIPDTNSNSDTTDDVAYGLWAHTGSFTFESIITPYDINGFGNYSTRTISDTPQMPRQLKAGNTDNRSGGSPKIMPSVDKRLYDLQSAGNQDGQSEFYLSTNNRITHEMRVFHNNNLKISLVNDTTHNQNNPAKYKIKVEITIDSVTQTITTDQSVINPVFSRNYSYSSTDGIDQLSGFTNDGKLKYRSLGTASGGTTSGTQVDFNFTPEDLFENKGQELYVRTGQKFTLLGKVATANQLLNIAQLESNLTRDIVVGEDIYIKTYGEPTYINKLFSLGVAYNDINRTLDIHLDGIKIKTQKITGVATGKKFSFSRTDCFLGANGTNKKGAESAITNNQFMGEFHELSILNYYKNKIISVPNLTPRLNDLLLYFRFEEIDE